MTRNVTQNTRPSFHFLGEGSGHETSMLPYASKISTGTGENNTVYTEPTPSHLLVRKRQFEYLALAGSEDLFDIKRQ